MSDNTVIRADRRPGGFQRRLTDVGRGFVLFLLAYPQVFLYVGVTLALACVSLFFGLFLVPPAILALRSLANHRRRLAKEWQGVDIPAPYRPRPEFSSEIVPGAWQRCVWLLTDPATWRDYAWATLDPIVGALLAILPITLIGEGIFGFVISAFWKPLTGAGFNNWYTFVHVTPSNPASHWLTLPVGAILIALGMWLAPRTLRLNARWTRLLLAPTAGAEMAQRVQHLTVARKDVIDTQAAEIRRIERDLHDGAQARLVAMGMNLNAAAQLLEKNPDAARGLLVEARDSSQKALTELRDLVRGIHPPVLADRGLADAVRALALDSALKTEVTVDLPGTLESPIESAAYFAVNEVLANAAKHSGAKRVWIEIRHAHGMLRLTVTDDGVGGADAAGGTGLRGVERRLATFDGILALTSPLGGPTVVTMELPCELSLPKISSS